MQPDLDVDLVYPSEEEKASILAGIEADPEARANFELGIRTGLDITVEKIEAGQMGGMAAAIDKSLKFLADDFARNRRAGGDTEDEIRFFLAGWMGISRAARKRFVATLAVLHKATEANELIAAGLSAAADAINMATALMPAPPPKPTHALMPQKLPSARPLRPEDLGPLLLVGRRDAPLR